MVLPLPRARRFIAVAVSLLAGCAAALLPALPARGDLPPIYTCQVSPDFGDAVLVAPQAMNGTTCTITVLADGVPIGAGKVVQVLFHSAIRTCGDAMHMAITDTNGSCQITLKGGGCLLASPGPACYVVVNGIEVRHFSRVRSPDNGAHDSSHPDGAVTVSDLVFFAAEFQGDAPAACHDYTNDGQVGTGDLPFFGDAFKAGMSCTIR